LDLEAGGSERLDGGLASGSGALYAHVNAAHAHGESLTSRLLRCHSGGKGRALLGALETGLAGRTPRYRVSAGIRDGNCRVVKGSLNVRDAFCVRNLLAPLRGIGHWKLTWSLSSCLQSRDAAPSSCGHSCACAAHEQAVRDGGECHGTNRCP